MTFCNHMCCHLCNGTLRSHFQQDNALPQTANVSQDYLHTVTTLPWPARSPDLSQIEHNWDNLQGELGIPRI
ncbi:hypothetical protein TNCV_3902831 [Trichonephila clavipes]|nr:hypothetical protein TNCV_3902831 [Trichonephila clavipes]